MIEINQQKLNELIAQANTSPRKRKTYNYHPQASDPLQRMLNAMNRGTYVQPHRHSDPPKREVFIILTGRIVVIQFDDSGKITESTILDAANGNFGVEIPECTWHTLVVLEENSVVYEVKDGPYSPSNDKEFASWAPVENSPGNQCAEYIDGLINKLGL